MKAWAESMGWYIGATFAVVLGIVFLLDSAFLACGTPYAPLWWTNWLRGG